MGKPKLIRYALLSLIGVTVIYIIPFIIAQSNFDASLFNSDGGLISNKGYLISFKNTVIFMISFVPAVVILGFILAYLTEKLKLGFVVKISIILPIALPVLAVVGFFRDNVDSFFKMFNGTVFIGIVFLWSCAGFTYLIFLVSLGNRNKSIEEAAYLDGAGIFRTIFNIIIPSHIEAVVLSTVISIYNSLKIFKQTYAMFGEYPKYDIFMMQNYLYLKLKYLDLKSLIVSADIFLVFILFVLIVILVFGEIHQKKLMR